MQKKNIVSFFESVLGVLGTVVHENNGAVAEVLMAGNSM